MTDIIKLLDYNIWANRRVLAQLMQLPENFVDQEIGGSFPSIRLTLVHLMNADWIWLNRWKGTAYITPPAEWENKDLAFIAETWLLIQEEAKKAGRRLLEEGITNIDFTTRKGEPYTMSFSDTVIHAFNHGTYHRGQIINMIRMQGEQPVNTDYFIYCSLK